MIGRRRRKNRFAFGAGFVLCAVFFAVAVVKAAPIDVGYIKNMQSNVPSASPSAGNHSLLGDDVNQNGVRDDVERWIVATFPGDVTARAVALQLGGAMQSVLAVGGEADEVSYGKARAGVEAALECLLASTGDDVQSVIFSQMLGVVLNTPERAAVVSRLEGRFPPSGIGFDSPSTGKCTFNLSAEKSPSERWGMKGDLV